MSNQKPSLPRGTRDFGPDKMVKRNFIFDTIKATFQKFGFMPLETPAMENLSVLMGKYGEEGDQLLFKILESGQFYEKMVKNITSERVTRIDTFLTDYFRSLLKEINNRLSDDELRSIGLVESEVSNLVDSLFNEHDIYLSNPDRSLLKFFLKERKGTIAMLVISFFQNIYKETFEKDFDFRFRQFRDAHLIEKVFNDSDLQNIKNNNEIAQSLIANLTSKQATREISEKGLRYDLTVPFARYVVMNRNEIKFPFKRYQIQPVWRGDSPQKGRYREFYQCDADVVGTDSLLCEAEIVLMMNEVLSKLGIKDFTIKINNRKILTGIAEAVGSPGKEGDLCVAIDKLDKIGREKVEKELEERGFSRESVEKLNPVFSLKGSFAEQKKALSELFASSETGRKGLEELGQVMQLVEAFDIGNTHLEFDTTLARGLSYYTGAIFEVKAHHVQIGSISGGGRYDNLTGSFGMPGISGVGFSFGVDRIYDVMEELNLFPQNNFTTTRVLFSHFDEAALLYTLPLLKQLRENGINSEVYPEAGKLKKQLDYANSKQIPFVVLVGSDEMASGKLTLKNMQIGSQQQVTLEELIKAVIL